ncbi:MAG: ABC transporter substrate-binding protein [Chloroflexi bacterium]|nr:ABC transporter substrate-binding protein [Chloroflexota bacterium]
MGRLAQLASTVLVLATLVVLSISCTPAAPAPAPTQPAAKSAEPAKPVAQPTPVPAPTKAPEPTKPAAPTPIAKEVPEQSKLTVGALPISSLAPFYIAEMKGWYKDEGITIGTTPQFGNQGMAILESGKMDLNFADVVGTITVLSEGFKFVVVAPASSARDAPPDSSALAVLKDSGVKRPKDLEGKRVAVDALRGMNWAYVRLLVQKDGGDPTKVNFVELPPPQMPDTLLNKQVDAANVMEPAHSLLLGTGKVDVMSYPLVGTQPKMDISMIVAREDWAKNNPITLRNFLRAYGKAIDFINQNEAEARKAVAEYAKLDPSVAGKMNLNAFRRQVQPDQMEKTMELMIQNGWLKEKIDIKKGIWPTALNLPR